MRLQQSARALLTFCLLSSPFACGGQDGDGDHGNENEVFTTVTLTFSPAGGGPAVTAKVDDPDGDGGDAPVVEAIALPAGIYDLTVKLENGLENPPEDLTQEVRDEGDEHQIFFTGTAVNGPASNMPGAPLTHAYADTDASGLPVGLVNRIEAVPGSGMLVVVLRHLPPLNGMAVKLASTAATVRGEGFAAIGGSTDVQVTFPLTVR